MSINISHHHYADVFPLFYFTQALNTMPRDLLTSIPELADWPPADSHCLSSGTPGNVSKFADSSWETSPCSWAHICLLSAWFRAMKSQRCSQWSRLPIVCCKTARNLETTRKWIWECAWVLLQCWQLTDLIWSLSSWSMVIGAAAMILRFLIQFNSTIFSPHKCVYI